MRQTLPFSKYGCIVKYLVTGCAGFIGSRVAEKLLCDGHQVHGVDNLNEYYDISLKYHRLESLLMHVGFSFEQAGIEDLSSVQRIFEQHSFDAVINLAAAVGVRYSLENPHVYMTTNGIGNLNLLEAMRHAGVSQVRIGVPRQACMPDSGCRSLKHCPSTLRFRHTQLPKNPPKRWRGPYHHLFDIDVFCRPLLHRLRTCWTTRHGDLPIRPLDR